jgi:two-component system osmolarity sensor histidine kinase EnvZ
VHPLRALKPKTLFGRALVIVAAPVVLLQVITSYVFFETHWDTVTRRLSLGLAGDIALIIRMLPTEDGRVHELAAAYLDLETTFLPGAVIEPPTRSPSRFNIPERMLNRALAERLFRPFAVDAMRFGDKVEIRVQLPEGVLRVLTPRKRLDSTTTTILVLWMIGSSLILLTVAVIFLRNQMRPIRRLAKVADDLGKGRDVADIRPRGAREIRQATLAFLAMRDRIQRQIAQRTEMLAGVSHDLRTPLTRMKLELAMIGGSQDVRQLENDVREMETMIEGYLAFARGQDTERVERTDLAAVLQDLVERARRQGLDLTLTTAGDLVLPLRPLAIRRCLQNLIDNAVRHGVTPARPNAAIVLAATRHDRAVEITVDDHGPGIPAERREEAVRPFSRLDAARNPSVPGVGLGLTIARDIARVHGGDLVLAESPQGGLRAIVRLPV